jgi:hypothetical protein
MAACVMAGLMWGTPAQAQMMNDVDLPGRDYA